MLRWIMVESARVAVRHNERMRGFYERVKRRRGMGRLSWLWRARC